MLEEAAEALVVGLAKTGDRAAFDELVRRRQSWIRNLMRRCCRDQVLADDLAQQAFLQAWKKISSLQHADRFGPWLKKVAINTWLQHARSNPTEEIPDGEIPEQAVSDSGSLGLDLDRALGLLSDTVRTCIVLSYSEGLSHGEIAGYLDIPVGTVKSHIRRGAERLRSLLADYSETEA